MAIGPTPLGTGVKEHPGLPRIALRPTTTAHLRARQTSYRLPTSAVTSVHVTIADASTRQILPNSQTRAAAGVNEATASMITAR